jgi:hypothetical protein
VPTGRTDQPSDPKDRLVELLDEFKQARTRLDEALQEQARLPDLGRVANEKWPSLLKEHPELAATSMIPHVSEQREIEHIHQGRKDAEGAVTDLRRKLVLTLRTAAISDPRAGAVLDQVDELSPYPTPEVVNAIVDLLQQLVTPSRKPRKAKAKRTGEDPLADVRKLVKQMCTEDTPQKEMCKRLGNMARPPGAKWRHLSWDAAFRHDDYRAAVKTKLSKMIHE